MTIATALPACDRCWLREDRIGDQRLPGTTIPTTTSASCGRCSHGADGCLTCLLGDAATADLPAGAYDAVTSISALDHTDLRAVLLCAVTGMSIWPQIGLRGTALDRPALHRRSCVTGLSAAWNRTMVQ